MGEHLTVVYDEEAGVGKKRLPEGFSARGNIIMCHFQVGFSILSLPIGVMGVRTVCCAQHLQRCACYPTAVCITPALAHRKTYSCESPFVETSTQRSMVSLFIRYSVVS